MTQIPKQARSSSPAPAWCWASVALLALACGAAEDPAPEPTEGADLAAQSEELIGTPIDTRGPTSTNTALGLALEFENGAGPVVRVRRGQRFFIEQLDLRGVIPSTIDREVDGLATEGPLRNLDWRGVELADEDFGGMQNPDGTFTRRRFYTGARWMERTSLMTVQQLDHRGRPTALPWLLNLGSSRQRGLLDTFFIRRARAIQWTHDCPSTSDCSGASLFEEEGLVEVRHSPWNLQSHKFATATTQLELRWTELPGQRWVVPVEQVVSPPYDYNLRVDLEVPPPPAGYFSPGDQVPVTMSFRDGSGARLHPAGTLPSYADVVFGPNPAGLQYYRAFFDATTTYYRRKHRERMTAIQLIGPAQDIQAIRTVAPIEQFLVPSETLTLGLPERDGMFAEAQLVPPAHLLFGGAFFPESGAWELPLSDTVTFTLPDNAPSGSYLITLKTRRTYLGQDIPHTATVEIQVGQTERTEPVLGTSGCNDCHNQAFAGDLGRVLHGNANRGACNGCHVPLGFELEGPVYVRTHFIHSRSERFGRSTKDCSSCHTTRESTQRVSKSACMSCHQSYPESHVAAFGPITNMYVGGGPESFESCTSSCHQSHPGSNL